MPSNCPGSRRLAPLDALLQGAPRRECALFEQPVLRVEVQAKDPRGVTCRVISTEKDGRIPFEHLAGGRYDARRERLESLNVGNVVRVHFGFDADGRLTFDERKLYNDTVFAAFPIGKSVRLPISRTDQAIGVQLRLSFGDGRSHEALVPRTHLRHSVSAYHVGQSIVAEVIVAQSAANGDVTIILSQRAQAFRRLSKLDNHTTVRARYRGFKNGRHQFALFSLRGTLHPDDLPVPLTAAQQEIGGWVNVRVKSFVAGRLLLTRKEVLDDALAL